MVRSITAETIESILRLKKNGHHIAEIGRTLGVSTATVRRYSSAKVRARHNEASRQRDEQKRISDVIYRTNAKKRATEWILHNPRKYIEIDIKRAQRIGSFYGKTWWEVFGLLQKWRYDILVKYDFTCAVCQKPANHAHHIFEKRFYPYLSLSINNGIALCPQHHKEIHSPWNYTNSVLLIKRLKV